MIPRRTQVLAAIVAFFAMILAAIPQANSAQAKTLPLTTVFNKQQVAIANQLSKQMRSGEFFMPAWRDSLRISIQMNRPVATPPVSLNKLSKTDNALLIHALKADPASTWSKTTPLAGNYANNMARYLHADFSTAVKLGLTSARSAHFMSMVKKTKGKKKKPVACSPEDPCPTTTGSTSSSQPVPAPGGPWNNGCGAPAQYNSSPVQVIASGQCEMGANSKFILLGSTTYDGIVHGDCYVYVLYAKVWLRPFDSDQWTGDVTSTQHSVGFFCVWGSDVMAAEMPARTPGEVNLDSARMLVNGCQWNATLQTHLGCRKFVMHFGWPWYEAKMTVKGKVVNADWNGCIIFYDDGKCLDPGREGTNWTNQPIDAYGRVTVGSMALTQASATSIQPDGSVTSSTGQVMVAPSVAATTVAADTSGYNSCVDATDLVACAVAQTPDVPSTGTTPAP